MATESPTSGDAKHVAPARPRAGGPPPAIVIPIVGCLVIVFFQAVGIVDRATSNIATLITGGVTLILLAAYTAFLSPLPRRAKWWRIGVPVAIIAVLLAVLRIDYFNGDLVPRFTWRWTKKQDVALAERGLSPSTGAADLTPSGHDYPGFLGPNRNAYVPDVKLATDWNAQPPKLRWKQPIGAGWSAFAVQGKAAITLEQRGDTELVSCYDLHSGAPVWTHGIQARHESPLGGDGPTSTPTIHEGRVYALGGTGVLRCLDGAAGKQTWIRDVLADVGTNYEIDHVGVSWSRSASPLIVDNMVVVPAGGPPAGPKFSLIAYDKLSGDIIWKGGDRQVSYSSPSLATYLGKRQIVIVNEASITGHDPATGNVLWETKWDGSSNTSATAPQTVQVADDKFFVSKGYSMGGGALFQLHKADDGTWTVEELWHNHRVLKTKFNNVVIVDGSVYGLNDGILECVNLATGEERWAGDEYGHGQLLRVGDLLLVTQEWGAVALVALDPAAFKELTRFQAIEGKTWNNPALSGNLLLIRNAQEAACYELPLAQ